MGLLVNLIRVMWSRTHTHFTVLKVIDSCLLDLPMASAKFHEAVAYAVSFVGRQNMTLTMKIKQEEALVVVIHL